MSFFKQCVKLQSTIWFSRYETLHVHSFLLLRLLPLLLSMVSVGALVVPLNNMYGIIRSPNFPEPYPKESALCWNISVPEGFQIRLYFVHFDLEPSYLCEYDYVKVSVYTCAFDKSNPVVHENARS